MPIPYLHFQGDCAKALAFCAETFASPAPPDTATGVSLAVQTLVGSSAALKVTKYPSTAPWLTTRMA